jgi:hypothetical protein
VVGHEGAWKVFQQAGIERVKARYTWDRTAEGYLEVLQAIQPEAVGELEIAIPGYFTDPDQADIPLSKLSELYLEG